MPSVFQQMTRQVYNAEPYSLTGKIENIVGMSIEASGGRAAIGDICRIYSNESGGRFPPRWWASRTTTSCSCPTPI